MRSPPRRFPLLALLALPPATAHVPPRLLPLSTHREAPTPRRENIARASSPTPRIDALPHGFTTGRRVITAAGSESVPRYRRNTAFTAGVRAQLRWTFGAGACAPVLSTAGGLAHPNTRIPGDTGGLATGALLLGQRLTDA